MKYGFLGTIVAILTLSLSATAQLPPSNYRPPNLPAFDKIKTDTDSLKITPVEHASLVLQWGDKTIYVDPADNPGLFIGMPAPDLILITDIHGDHMNVQVLEEVNNKNAIMVMPQAVADKLPFAKDKFVILKNGDKTDQLGINITAIPMYNLPESPTAMHPKGRGNGYVLTIGGKKIYISGDTGDIPEMRSLKNIDVAFVCMNLPYTMDVNHAASAVLDFKPKIVYPYHHRGQDIKVFKKLVNDKNKNIDVRLRNWYPKGE